MDYFVSFPSQLNEHLRSLRKARGLTQTQLAQKLGVVQSRIAAIERKPESMSVGYFFEVLAALDVQLVLRDKQPIPPVMGKKPEPSRGSW